LNVQHIKDLKKSYPGKKRGTEPVKKKDVTERNQGAASGQATQEPYKGPHENAARGRRDRKSRPTLGLDHKIIYNPPRALGRPKENQKRNDTGGGQEEIQTTAGGKKDEVEGESARRIQGQRVKKKGGASEPTTRSGIGI